MQTLNGEQAMGLVRFRKSDRGANGRISGYDDTGRVATQQAFLKAMFKQCLKIKNWTKITGYVEIFEKNVESDLTLGNMLWFARQAMNLSEDGFQTMTAPANYYAQAWSRSIHQMQSYVTIYANQMLTTVNESFNPYLTRVTTANLDIMSINADGSLSSTSGYVADSRAETPPVRESEEPEEETPAETETPAEPADPAAPTNPADPAAPTNPTTPTTATNPTGSTTPTENPTTAENPTGEQTAPPTQTTEPPAETPSAPTTESPTETPPTETPPAEPPAEAPSAAPAETTPTTPTESAGAE